MLSSIVATCDGMCWLVLWDAMIFCNNFARWLQKIVATCVWCSRRQLTPFLERISYGLGQRYHNFDEISLLFETTHWYFRPRYVVLSDCREVSNNNEISSNDDNVVQAMRTFQTIRQNWQPRIQVEILGKCLKCPHGLDNVIIIWWNLDIVRENSAIARTT